MGMRAFEKCVTNCNVTMFRNLNVYAIEMLINEAQALVKVKLT